MLFSKAGGIVMSNDYTEEMVGIRRHLHKRPEEGWTEFETTWFIVQRGIGGVFRSTRTGNVSGL